VTSTTSGFQPSNPCQPHHPDVPWVGRKELSNDAAIATAAEVASMPGVSKARPSAPPDAPPASGRVASSAVRRDGRTGSPCWLPIHLGHVSGDRPDRRQALQIVPFGAAWNAALDELDHCYIGGSGAPAMPPSRHDECSVWAPPQRFGEAVRRSRLATLAARPERAGAERAAPGLFIGLEPDDVRA
jgi:hypothetical protein